jgi:hypothetical protein
MRRGLALLLLLVLPLPFSWAAVESHGSKEARGCASTARFALK